MAVIGMCLVCLAGFPLWGVEPDAAKATSSAGVRVHLRFSVPELDPLAAGESYVECMIRNIGHRPLLVPSGYAGGFKERELVLESNDLELIHWAGAKTQPRTTLEPGKELIAFKARLVEILRLDGKARESLKPNETRYYWSWRR